MNTLGVFKTKSCIILPLCLEIFLDQTTLQKDEFPVLHWMGNNNKPNDTAGRGGQELFYIWAFPTLHPAGINKFV